MADDEVSCMKLLIAKMIPTYTPEVTDTTDENEVNGCMTQLLLRTIRLSSNKQLHSEYINSKRR